MRRWPLDHNSTLALFGLIAMAIGLGLIFLPAAFVAVGVLLIIYAVMPDRGGPTTP